MTTTIKQSLSALLSTLPISDSGNPEAAGAAYMMALEGVDAKHVQEAVKRFIRGEVKRHNHRFAPTAPELAIEARRLQDDAKARAYVALPKPAEKPITPEERAKVGALLEQLAKRIAPPPRRPMTADECLEIDIADPRPIRVSAALISKIQKEATP